MELFSKFLTVIVNPLVKLMFAAAVVYFVYGVFNYIRSSDSDTGRREGSNHILWATIGLFVMVSVWGIMGFIRNVVTGQ